MYLKRKCSSEENGFLTKFSVTWSITLCSCWTLFHAPELADNTFIDLVASTAVTHVSPSEWRMSPVSGEKIVVFSHSPRPQSPPERGQLPHRQYGRESLFLISVNQWLSSRDCMKHISEIFILSCEIKFLSRPPISGESGDCVPDKSCLLSEVSSRHLSSSLHTFVIFEPLNSDSEHGDGRSSASLLQRPDHLVGGFILFSTLRRRKN